MNIFRSFAVAFAVAAVAGPALGAEKLKALIVTGHDAGAHKWQETTRLDREALEKSGRFDVRVSEDVGILESGTLSQYDVLILNFGFWQAPLPTPEAQAGLLNYVKSGKGLLSVHFSCSSYQEWDEYHELLGRWWKRGVGGHGPRGQFRVKIDAIDHPITKGIGDFEADDELYAKLTGDAEIEVLASAFSEWSGKVEPLVFTKKYGEGRVVQSLLGHDVKARSNPAYQTILVRSAEWAATGKVTVQ